MEIISKKPRFVIFLVLALFSAGACSLVPSQSGSKSERKLSEDYGEAVVAGRIASREITESSGITNPGCQSDVFWTHNDSGDKNYIFALNSKGKSLGRWRVAGASNRDWEDIGSYKDSDGKCLIYVGDIGNNGRIRSSFTIYRFREPSIGNEKTGKGITEEAESIVFSYPDMRHNAEALFVHPVTKEIYVITKRLSGAAGVYKLKNGAKVAKKVADIEVPSVPNGMITGAGVSPDGRRVIVCDYFGGYEFVLPGDASDFDEIWKQKPRLVDLGTREQGEAVTYSADGESIYATSEHRNSPLIKVSRKILD